MCVCVCVCVCDLVTKQPERRVNGRGASQMSKPSASWPGGPGPQASLTPASRVFPAPSPPLTSPDIDVNTPIAGVICLLMISSKCGSYHIILTLAYANHHPTPKDTNETQSFGRTRRTPTLHGRSIHQAASVCQRGTPPNGPNLATALLTTLLFFPHFSR